MTNTVKQDLAEIFQRLTDLSSLSLESPAAALDAAVTELAGLRSKHSDQSLVDTAIEIADGDARELYWMARAGFHSNLEGCLADLLEHDEDLEAAWAALGLAYLGNQAGVAKLKALAQAAAGTSSDLTLDELKEELDSCQLDSLKALKEHVNSLV